MTNFKENKTESSVDDKRTSIQISLSMNDKKALKMMAAERGTTVAAMIHEWIEEHRKN